MFANLRETFKKFAQISVNSRIKFFVITSPLLLQEVKSVLHILEILLVFPV